MTVESSPKGVLRLLAYVPRLDPVRGGLRAADRSIALSHVSGRLCRPGQCPLLASQLNMSALRRKA